MEKQAYYTFAQFNMRLLRIGYTKDHITSLALAQHVEGSNTPSPLSDMAYRQLSEYFGQTRQTFDLPLMPKGTPFQEKVWTALQHIPYGQTRSYKEIAQMIHHPKAYRAVGMANNRNPLMILIPCHRVIGSNKQLVGYAGGLDIKKELLALEHSFNQT